MFINTFAKLVSGFLAILMFFATPSHWVTGKRTQPIADKEEGCEMSFAVISDTHIDEKIPVISDGMLELGLIDMENAEDRLDAVVFDGDITNHGYYEQWDIFAGSISKHDIADKLILVTGNHDTWGPNRDDFTNPVDGVLATFTGYNKSIAGRDIDKMYYAEDINDYPVICLGSERDNVSAYLSDEQLEWFAEEMEKAAATGKPIFVFLHQSINGTHGLPYNWGLSKKDPADEGGIGEQSDRVVEILKKYDNVFYISGHIHAGFKTENDIIGADYASVEYMENNNGNNITLINLPSFTNPDVIRGSHLVNGCGYVIEAYEDKVEIRARNFGAGTWLLKYDVTVDLVD